MEIIAEQLRNDEKYLTEIYNDKSLDEKEFTAMITKSEKKVKAK
jgi:hypothetical protein